MRCELQSFTCSPDPPFSTSARELAATRRTFGAQKRAITARTAFPRDPKHPAALSRAERLSSALAMDNESTTESLYTVSDNSEVPDDDGLEEEDGYSEGAAAP